MESKELIVTMLCYIGVLLEICIEYVINRCHYFGWYELGFNCCVFAMVLIVVLVVCWIYFLFVLVMLFHTTWKTSHSSKKVRSYRNGTRI